MKTEKTAAPKTLELTKMQAAAVRASGKNILVSAGAGTGKTRVLVERFLHFVTGGEALVTEILALTFTDKAASEMKKRISDRFGDLGLESARHDLESAYISTIHSFAARVLREHPLEAGLDPDFRVIEPEEAYFLKEQALDEVLENACRKGTGAFDLLRVYGETCIRDSLLKVYEAAAGEGKSSSDFMVRPETDKPGNIADTIEQLLTALEEEELAREWKHYGSLQPWDWRVVSAFHEWCGKFSRKRGKKGDNAWPEVKRLCKVFLARKLDLLAAEWREKFEALAVNFEKAYGARKKEAGALDFSDLEIQVVRLMKKEGPMYAKLRERYRRKFKFIMVDEFQDTNLLQKEMIEQIAGPGNLFYVGDYKQSIYGFRGAEPSLFLDLEHRYNKEENGVRIRLLENFRTAGPVLEFINRFFENLWQEDNHPFEGLLARSCDSGKCGTELLLVKQTEDEPLKQARMREADHIADRIIELNEEGSAFGDIAVLFQAMTDIALYEQALKKNGIPYYVLGGSGFYYQHEIRDMISFLSFLENPLADLPLAASLRSPMFQISDDTLFWLSRRAKEISHGSAATPLYEGVKKFEIISEIKEEEKNKLRFFMDVSTELMATKDQLRLTELLDGILEKTSYELTALADTQGIRKYANLKKMVNLARELESFEPMPVGGFLRALKRLELQEARESEAQIEAEQSRHVVRLMSIHRSKGLEFPVVFVADMGHSKQSSESKTLLAKTGAGYAMQVRNPMTYEMEKPWSWQVINEAENRKQKEEWKRLFYVAVTRAQTRLILSGVHSEKKKEKTNFNEMSSWMDWLMLSNLEGVEIRESSGEQKHKRKRALAERRDLKAFFANFEPLPPEKLVASEKVREKLNFVAEKIFRAVSPVERLPSRSIDLPVSAYASFRKNPQSYWLTYEIGAPDDYTAEERKSIITEDEEVSAADFGTLMHQVLEKISFDDTGRTEARGHVRYFFKHLDEESRQNAEVIVSRFLESALFKRLEKAKKIYRELPFVLNERHGIIHGVIDLLYQDERGTWHVLDYKTAVGSEDKVRESGYVAQISIYAHAVHRILGQSPASGTLYFLKNNWEHRVDWKAGDYKLIGSKIKALQDDLLAFTLQKKNSGKSVHSPTESK